MQVQSRFWSGHERSGTGGGDARPNSTVMHDYGDGLVRIASQYMSDIQPILEAPWATATIDLVNPKTRGARPPDLEERVRYMKAIQRLAANDPEAHKIMAEVNHLIRPHNALREPQFMSRVVSYMKASV